MRKGPIGEDIVEPKKMKVLLYRQEEKEGCSKPRE